MTRVVGLIVPIVIFFSGSGLCRGDNDSELAVKEERLKTAKKTYDRYIADFSRGRSSAWAVYLWSERMMESELLMESGGNGRRRIVAAHLERMTALNLSVKKDVALQRVGLESYIVADVYRSDAKLALLCLQPEKNGDEIRSESISRLAALVLIHNAWWSTLDDKRQAIHLATALYWSNRWYEAEFQAASTPEEKRVAAEAYFSRAKEMELSAKKWGEKKQIHSWVSRQASYYRISAEISLDRVTEKSKKDDEARLKLEKELIQTVGDAYKLEWEAFGDG